MVTMRSLCGIDSERTLRSVVLPEPVPPVMSMFTRAFTSPERSSSISGVIDSFLSRSSSERTSRRNFRIDR